MRFELSCECEEIFIITYDFYFFTSSSFFLEKMSSYFVLRHYNNIYSESVLKDCANTSVIISYNVTLVHLCLKFLSKLVITYLYLHTCTLSISSVITWYMYPDFWLADATHHMMTNVSFSDWLLKNISHLQFDWLRHEEDGLGYL